MGRLAALLLSFLAGAALAQNACDECRAAALAQSAVCHRAALNPTEAADCNLKLQAARERCQATECRSAEEARLYALCTECGTLAGPARSRCVKTFCKPAAPPKR
jgi:hypothetical protein